MRRTHRTFSTRHRIIDTGGAVHEVVVIGDQLNDDSGRLIGTHGFYVDVTPTRRDDQGDRLRGADRDHREPLGHRTGQGHADADLPGGAATAFELLRWRSQESNVKLRMLAEQLLADYAGLTYDELLPPRATFDHLLLTAHQRVGRGDTVEREEVKDGSPGR